MKCLGSPLRLTYRIFLFLSLFSIAAAAQMALSVQSVNFGNIQIGSNLIVPLTVANNGKSYMTISRVIVSGTGFAFVGPNLPITIPPRQNIALSVAFAPQTSASFSGSVSVSYSGNWGGHNAVHTGFAAATLSGTGAGSAYLSAPANMNLGSLQTGSSQTQTLTVSNTGASSLSISAATISGSGFTISGLTLPYDLAAGASANLYVTFSPTTSGTDNASLTLASNASDPSVSVALTGIGTTTSGTIGVTPSSMSFGNVTIGTTQTQSGSITANGGSVTLSSTSSNNSAFTIGGLTLPVTLAVGQSVPFIVSFAPTTNGTVAGNISFFTSNSASVSETANGSGATVQHTVGLSWNASTSDSITGYNVYRGTSALGPYSRINSGLDGSVSYRDSAVQSGQTYYYATTAVDSTGAESSYSNQVQVVVPFP